MHNIYYNSNSDHHQGNKWFTQNLIQKAYRLSFSGLTRAKCWRARLVTISLAQCAG